MNLKEFISNVLQDIDDGVLAASVKTNRFYHVGSVTQDGVHFDIAVKASNTKAKKAKGEAKAGFIEVLGASVNGEISEEKQNSEVSRIEFTIHVPSRTKQEIEDETRQAVEANARNAEKVNY